LIAELAARSIPSNSRQTAKSITIWRNGSSADARHLRWLRDSLGDRFVGGAVLHTGPAVFRLDHQILAVPICAAWA
jgi:hypothetical protein